MYFIRNLIYTLLSPVRALLYSPMRLIQAPKRFLGMSLPARVAWALALVLILATIGAFVAFVLSPDSSRWEVWFEPLHILVIVGLIIAIPLVTYYALRLWLEGEASPYEDIDRAWKEGVAELERHGIDWNRVPLFLVVGAKGEDQADALMEAGGMELVVSGVPEGRAPLRWYASDRAIFLFSTGAGCLAQVNRTASHSPALAPAPGGAPQPSIKGTLVAGAGVRGTAAPAAAGPAATVAQEAPAVSYDQIRGTLMPGMSAGRNDGASLNASPTSDASALSRYDRQEQLQRLEYVCRLLYRLRQPLCPLNGMLVLAGWNAIQGPYGARDLPESMRLDLECIRQATAICCPVLTLVTGLESEPGFLELARRVGEQQARSTRFGRGFDHWTPPTAENLDALTSHACGAFEDWVYDLFQRPDALSKPGNSKLYTLLCRIRSLVQDRLRTVLIQGMGSDVGQAASGERPNLYGGCYFAATGESSDRQSFVRGVLDKLLQLEEELEWTDQAVRLDSFYRRLANFLVVTNGVLVLAILALLGYWLWGS